MIGLPWEDERYVRAYVRDTEEYLCLSWQAQGLYWAIRRKVDRAGLLTARNGAASVALLTRWPREVVTEFLPELLDARFVVEDQRGYLLPEFLASEEAKQSNAQRSRESRARRVDVAALNEGVRESVAGPITSAEPRVSDDAKRDAAVRGHAEEQGQRRHERFATQQDASDAQRSASETTLRALPSVPSVPVPSRTVAVQAVHSPPDQIGRPNMSRLAEIGWDRVSKLRVLLAAEIGLDGIMPLALFDKGSRDLKDRLGEAGDAAEARLDHALLVLEAEARASRSVEWVSGKSFTDAAWQRLMTAQRPAARRADSGDGYRERGGSTARPEDADERAKARIAQLDAEAAERRARGSR